MANSPQARKRIRQTERRTQVNRARRSEMRTTVKKSETAIAAGDKQAIGGTFQQAMSALHKAVKNGIISKNAASRKISRLAARIAKAS